MSVFSTFSSDVQNQTDLRNQITKAMRRPEPVCVEELLKQATLSETTNNRIATHAKSLTQYLRKHRHLKGVETLVQEFSLSSAEGTALMCLAEALLRIPDNATQR